MILLINDTIIDLFPNTVIAYNYKTIEIGDITSRYATHTNTISAIKSDKNNKAFGFANRIEYGSTTPYKKLPAFVQQGSLTTISGYAVIKEVSDRYMITVFDSFVDFGTTIGDKSIQEITTGDVDESTTLVLTPQINYSDISVTGDQDLCDIDNYRCFSYKELITRIFNQNGFTVTGDVLNNSRFTKTFIAGLGFGGYNESFKDTRDFILARSSDYAQGMNGSWFKMQFNNAINGSPYWDGVDDYVVGYPPNSTYALDYYELNISWRIDAELTNGAGDTVAVELYHSRLGTIASIGTYSNGSRQVTQGSATVACRYNDNIYIRFRRVTVGGTFTVFSNSTFQAEVTSTFYTYRSIQGLFPDIKQIDVLRDFFVSYGIIPLFKGNTITLKTINEIIQSKPSAIDWSEKRVGESERLIFTYKEFSQENEFVYETDDLTDRMTYGGILNVVNETLSARAEYYKSIVTQSKTQLMGNTTDGFVTCARIPIFADGTTTETNDPKFRLVLIRDKRSDEIGASKTAYFSDPAEADNIDFESLLTANYSLFESALQKCVVAERQFLLTSYDIVQLTPHKLITDHGDTFIVLSINNWVEDKPVKVQLLKV